MNSDSTKRTSSRAKLGWHKNDERNSTGSLLPLHEIGKLHTSADTLFLTILQATDGQTPDERQKAFDGKGLGGGSAGWVVEWRTMRSQTHAPLGFFFLFFLVHLTRRPTVIVFGLHPSLLGAGLAEP
jgi:hypothetical protein